MSRMSFSAPTGRGKPSSPGPQGARGGFWHYVTAALKQFKLAMVTTRSGRDTYSVALSAGRSTHRLRRALLHLL
jgi:hypothetical protein